MTIRSRRSRRQRRSFTLVESIATIVVLAIVSSVSSGVILQATDGYVEAGTTAQLHAELSVAMDRMARELRKIPLDSAAAGIAPDVALINWTSVTWSTNSIIQKVGSDVTLTLSGGAARPLLTDVTAFSVTAYNESNVALGPVIAGASCDPVRRIELDVTVQRYGAQARLRSRVFLRSTMAGASS